jgi:hypothetical protein
MASLEVPEETISIVQEKRPHQLWRSSDPDFKDQQIPGLDKRDRTLLLNDIEKQRPKSGVVVLVEFEYDGAQEILVFDESHLFIHLLGILRLIFGHDTGSTLYRDRRGHKHPEVFQEWKDFMVYVIKTIIPKICGDKLGFDNYLKFARFIEYGGIEQVFRTTYREHYGVELTNLVEKVMGGYEAVIRQQLQERPYNVGLVMDTNTALQAYVAHLIDNYRNGYNTDPAKRQRTG